MPTVLQFRRGTTAQNNAFTGAAGEMSIDTDNDSIRVHDGSTAGGFETNAKQAQYADVAERYRADAEYDPGTLLVFGGDAEITISTEKYSKRIAGIVSTDPYCVMNSPKDERNDPTFPAMALLGRVPAKVIGEVRKGDLMVASDTPGHAEAWRDESNPPSGSVVGKAVEDKTGAGAGEIEISVGRL
jgi:hypothetical protein